MTEPASATPASATPAYEAGLNAIDGKRPQLPLLVMPTYQQAERIKESPGQIEAFG